MIQTSQPTRYTPIPLDFLDPDPMLDISAIEEENDEISNYHYSCASDEY